MPAYRRNHEYPASEHFYNGVAAPPFASEGVAAGTTREGASSFDTKAPRTSAFAGVIATVGLRPGLNPSRERSNLPDGFLGLAAARSRARSPRHPPQGPSGQSQPALREKTTPVASRSLPGSRSTVCWSTRRRSCTLLARVRTRSERFACVPQACACTRVYVGYFSRAEPGRGRSFIHM